MQNILLQISASVTEALTEKYVIFLKFSPFILGALAVFLSGWILAELAALAIKGMARKLKLEIISEKIGLKRLLERSGYTLSPSHLIAHTLKMYLIFLFFIEATKVARLTQVADFLGTVIDYIPQVIIALFIMLVGVRIADSMQTFVSASLSFAKSSTSRVLGLGAKYTIITFSVLTALAQLKIAPILVQIMFIGFISMLALAGGLAFGLGGKDMIREILENVKRTEAKED